MEKAISRHYTLLKPLGSGAVGVVYHAVDPCTKHSVAIKVIPRTQSLPPLDKLSVLREIHALQTLSHPNILSCLHIRGDEHYLYLATEFCSRGDLFSILSRDGPLPESTGLSIARDILHALAYMHTHGFAHRDVKLENILVAEDGSVRLADFDLACYRAPADPDVTSTRRCGTPRYVAPEIVRRKAYLPSHADIWAVGIVLYAMFMTALPFDDKDERVVMRKIVRADASVVAGRLGRVGVSRQTRAVVESLLAGQPEERPSATEAANMCGKVLMKFGD